MMGLNNLYGHAVPYYMGVDRYRQAAERLRDRILGLAMNDLVSLYKALRPLAQQLGL